MLTIYTSSRYLDHLTPPGHPERPERAETEAAREKRQKREAVEKETTELVARLGERAAQAKSPKDAADFRLLAGLLEYHARERRPIWWGHFARLAMTEDELVDEVESIAGLVPDPKHPPVPEKKSMAHAFTYPVQETKLGASPPPQSRL